MKVALLGNPNCGKTTLFNALTGLKKTVGNWAGVTIEKASGIVKGTDAELIDLPGVYSLSPYSPEERITKDFITGNDVDLIINIVDASNLERNLFLTLEALHVNSNVLVALNMADIVEKRGDIIDIAKLENFLNVKVIPISALKRTNIDKLIDAVKTYSKQENFALSTLQFLHEDDRIEQLYIKSEDIYKNVYTKNKGKMVNITEKIDKVLTHRIWGLPIFLCIMFFVYFISVSTVGTFFSDLINDNLFGDLLIGRFGEYLASIGTQAWLVSFLTNGIFGGIGAVIGFLPQIALLFTFLAILEDSGYMARVAYLMDGFFKKFGLSGKAFIPLLIGAGCSVPAIMSTRTIETESERKISIITTSFIPCSAKLPIIAMIATAYFGVGSAFLAPIIYVVGIGSVLISGLILKKMKVLKGDYQPFVMELPDYHTPSFKSVGLKVWQKVKAFIIKAGTIIFLASAVIWFLSNFSLSFKMVETESSILATVGRIISFVFAPLGFGNWQSTISTLTGLVAKENLVMTLSILSFENGFTAISALSFLIFNMLCTPCIGAIGAIKKEMQSSKWTWFALGYQIVFAYISAFLVYQLGSLLINSWISFVLVVVIAMFLILVLIKLSKDKKLGKCVSCADCPSKEICKSNIKNDKIIK